MNHAENPYVAGNPIRGDKGFFGRQDTLDWVRRELQKPNTNSLVLFGQRRIGKTSLLLQLERIIKTENFLPVYFELHDQTSRSLNIVLTNLARSIRKTVRFELPIPTVRDDPGDFFQNKFLKSLYDHLEKNCRPVVLFDEFDVLDQPIDNRSSTQPTAGTELFPLLCRLIAEDTRLAFVFAVGRRTEDLTLDFKSTFKASSSHEIWVLDQADAEKLVRQAEENNTLRFTDDAVTRILSLTHCHPYLTQLLCQRIWDRAHTNNSSIIPVVDSLQVDASIPDALAAGQGGIGWLWEGLSPAEMVYASALVEIADEGKIISEEDVVKVLSNHNTWRLFTSEVEAAPTTLVKRRILERVDDKRKYRFAIELLRRWIRENKPLLDVQNELDKIDPIADTWFKHGEGFFNQGKYNDAVRYLSQAVQKNPMHFYAQLKLGEAYIKCGEEEKAIVPLQKAYELDRNRAHLLFLRTLKTLAKKLYTKAEYDEALKACVKVLELSPNDGEMQDLSKSIYEKRGDSALEKTAYLEALECYQKAENKEKSEQAKKLHQSKIIKTREREAKKLEKDRRWTDAKYIYGKLVSEALDDASRQGWQERYQFCEKEEKLAHLYAESVKALEEGDRNKAKRKLTEILIKNPDYENDGVFVASRLNMLVAQTNVDYSRILKKVSIIAIVFSIVIFLFGLGVKLTVDNIRNYIPASATSRYLDELQAKSRGEATQHALLTTTSMSQKVATIQAFGTSTSQQLATMQVYGTSTSQKLATIQVLGTPTAIQSTISAIMPYLATADASTPVFGPFSANLSHQEGTYYISPANTDIRDFVSEISFYSPYSRVRGDWDFGIIFRQTVTYKIFSKESKYFVLIIRSNGEWYLNAIKEKEKINKTVAKGQVSNLNLDVDAPNHLRLVVVGRFGYFLVNNAFVSDFDLSDISEPGDVLAVAGFSDHISGEVTHFENFTVKRIP